MKSPARSLQNLSSIAAELVRRGWPRLEPDDPDDGDSTEPCGCWWCFTGDAADRGGRGDVDGIAQLLTLHHDTDGWNATISGDADGALVDVTIWTGARGAEQWLATMPVWPGLPAVAAFAAALLRAGDGGGGGAG